MSTVLEQPSTTGRAKGSVPAPVFFEVERLSLSFGGVKAVRDVSFAVSEGEVCAIIGPNGAGKTSVFNLITRVFDATSGQVCFRGADILKLKRHEVVRHGIARTFQNIELFEGASVLQNLLLGRHTSAHRNIVAQMLNLPNVIRAEVYARERVEAIINLLGLEPYRDSLVAGLPYGVRKIVELGRALAAEPKLLLLDEPASGLNPEETFELAGWIHDVRSELGLSVIMVEHDMSLVSSVADRVIVMEQGKVLMIGTPAEVQSDPRVIAAYIGD